MRRDSVLSVVLIAVTMLLLLGTGCGIITAPVSVPQAIAANHDAHLEGTITDAAGNPVHDVTLTVQKEHTFWDAAMGSRIEYEDSSSVVSGKFSVSRRGSSRVRLTFAKPGYLPALVEFDDHGLYLVTAATTQPGAADLGVAADTQPGNPHFQGGMLFMHFGMPGNRNAMFIDEAWKPGKLVRIILYPAGAK